MKLFLLSIATVSLLSACDARVNVPPGETKTTIVTPGEKKTENNTTIVNPATEKKTETNTTVTPGGSVEKSTTTTTK